MYELVIYNCIIISAHSRYKPLVGSIGVKDGVIDYVGEKALMPTDGKNYIDGTGKILMPGLVNGHCHGDMAFAKGMGDGLTLQEQMQKFADSNWFFNCITDEDRYYSRVHTYMEAALSGTTFMTENMYWSLGELSQHALQTVGIKGALAEDVRQDFTKPDEFISEETVQSFIRQCTENGNVPVLGSISEEDFVDHRLKKVKEIHVRNDCFITCHLAETTWRNDIVEKSFRKSSVKVLEEYGLLSERFIGSHAVYLDGDDIKIMANHNAKVVNTPLCEMKIADGLAPIPEMVKNGLTVGIGTDGAMWNNSNDLFREMKGMALVHSLNRGVRVLDARNILDMATINGAKIFGLEDEIGTIEVGKRADMILVDATMPHMTPLRLNGNENVCSNIVFCATGGDVRDVFVEGRQIVKNHKLLNVDMEQVQKYVLEMSKKVFK